MWNHWKWRQCPFQGTKSFYAVLVSLRSATWKQKQVSFQTLHWFSLWYWVLQCENNKVPSNNKVLSNKKRLPSKPHIGSCSIRFAFELWHVKKTRPTKQQSFFQSLHQVLLCILCYWFLWCKSNNSFPHFLMGLMYLALLSYQSGMQACAGLQKLKHRGRTGSSHSSTIYENSSTAAFSNRGVLQDNSRCPSWMPSLTHPVQLIPREDHTRSTPWPPCIHIHCWQAHIYATYNSLMTLILWAAEMVNFKT